MKIFMFCILVGIYFTISPLKAYAKKVSGDTITVIDANLQLKAQQGSTGFHIQNIVRLCIGGLEFVDINKTAAPVQVIDKTGKPKTCK